MHTTGADQNTNVERWLTSLLLVCLGLQCWGVARCAYRGETPVFEVLLYEWHWPEARVQQVEQGAIAILTLAGFVLLPSAMAVARGRLLRSRLLSGLVAATCLIVMAWQLAQTIAARQRHDGFRPPISWGWLEDRLLDWSVFGEEAIRIGTPLALVLLLTWISFGKMHGRRIEATIWVLRLAAVVVFFVHGYEALRQNPRFIDLLLSAAKRFHWDVGETTAKQVLIGIAVVDFAVAALLLSGRWAKCAGYMAFWGFLTAASRMVQSGWGNYGETLLRVGNGGIPLAISIYWWHLARCQPAESSLPPSSLPPSDPHEKHES